MDGGDIAFSAPRGGETAHTANVENLDRKTIGFETRGNDVQPDAVAADDNQIRRSMGTADDLYIDRRPGRDALCVLSDRDEAIGLRERGDRTGTLCDRIGDERTVHGAGQRDHQKFRAAKLRGNPHWQCRRDLLLALGRETGKGPDDGCYELMERENRRGRKAGQDDQRFAACDRQAHRFARLQRDAMHHDAGIPIKSTTR